MTHAAPGLFRTPLSQFSMEVIEATPAPKELTACTAEAVAELSRFVALLHKYFAMQLPYDIHTNLPSRVIRREDLPQHTLRSALVSAIGEFQGWEPDAVTKLAAEILEDSNIHDLAAVLYAEVPPRPES